MHKTVADANLLLIFEVSTLYFKWVGREGVHNHPCLLGYTTCI
jgi:hypothetical protein